MTDAKAVRIGIAWMLAATVLWTGMDTLNKHLSQDYPALQVALMRFSVHTVLILAIGVRQLRPLFATPHWRLQLLRSSCLTLGTILIVFSFQALPLLFVSAVAMMTPVMVTALSGPMLGERVGWRRWSSVCAGFLGAMVVINPVGAGLSVLVLLPLGSAFVNAFYQGATRKLGGQDSSATTIAYTGVVGTLAGLACVPLVGAGIVPQAAVWVAPDAAGWFWLLVLGALGLISHYMMILAYTAAPAAVVAPFAYAGLIWSALAGIFVFGEIPSWTTLVGAVIIAGSGLYILHREQVRRR